MYNFVDGGAYKEAYDELEGLFDDLEDGAMT
jgi:hypothetical protein